MVLTLGTIVVFLLPAVWLIRLGVLNDRGRLRRNTLALGYAIACMDNHHAMYRQHVVDRATRQDYDNTSLAGTGDQS
jgi:hypothetical protein